MLTLYVKGQILKSRFQELLKSEKGQGMVEYAMIIGLVSIGVLVLLGLMSTQIGHMFTNITESLKGIKSQAAPAPL